MGTPEITTETHVNEDHAYDSQEEIPFLASLNENQEVVLDPFITTVISDANSNARRNLWSEEMVCALIDEVEKRHSFLQERPEKQKKRWMEITEVMKLYNPDVSCQQVRKKWQNTMTTMRRYNEGVRWGERSRASKPLFFDRIRGIVGDSELRFRPFVDNLPEINDAELLPREVNHSSRIIKKEVDIPSGKNKRKLVSNVLETLAQVCNTDEFQGFRTDSDTDLASEDEWPVEEKRRWRHAVPTGKFRKLNDMERKNTPCKPPSDTSPYRCRFREEWRSKWPCIRKGATAYQYWCNLCKTMDFCDTGTEAIRRHMISRVHQEKLKAEGAIFRVVSKASFMPDHLGSIKAGTKNLSIKTLKHMIAAKPEIVNRTVIVSVDVKTQPRSNTDMVKDILSVIGEENVEEIDVVTKTYILVTFRKGHENLMDTIRMIRYYDVFNMIEILYSLHFPHAIKASVEGTLEGLPRLISSTQLSYIKEIVNQLYPFLSDVTVDYIPWPGTSLLSGNIRIKASLTDLKSSYQRLKATREIQLGVFSGKLTLDKFKVISQHCPETFSLEPRDGITILKW